MDLYWSLFLLGLAGSGHCLGMCGGFVLGVARGREYRRYLFGYQAGRLMAYAMLGATLGTLGLGISRWLSAPTMKMVAGLAMIVLGFGWVAPTSLLPRGAVARLGGKLLSGKERSQVSVLIGMLSGLLPCGLLYAALAECTLANGPVAGGLAMACFWLGTTPALTGLALSGIKIPPKMGAWLCAGLGGWLIYKALTVPACCH